MKKIFIMLFLAIFLLGCNSSISNCLDGYHEFDDGKVKEETIDSTIMKYRCKHCFETYEISIKEKKLYFNDMFHGKFYIDDWVIFSEKNNEYISFTDYQKEYILDLFNKMEKCELSYMNKKCNCMYKVEFETSNGLCGFSFHNDHLVLKSVRRGSDFWYVIHDCDSFTMDMFNEIYNWVRDKENIIN